MRKAFLLLAIALAATTLRADPLMQSWIEALTPLDALPTTAALDIAFTNQTVEHLQAIALSTDATLDFGVQLRAIRALPSYCPAAAPCGVAPADGPDTLVHATLVQLLQNFEAIQVPKPIDLLRLRAAIEALSIAGVSSALPGDEALIQSFLDNASRDVRATTAKALATLRVCTNAPKALRTRFAAELSAQVRLAISAALRDLMGVCSL